jgi:hypothetical protein
MPKNELLANAEKLDLDTLENRTEFLEVTCDYGGDCENTSNQPK